MIDSASLPYRDAVGIMLLAQDHRVFVARRIDMKSEAWQMPQGGMDEGETLLICAMRELKEEIGTNKAEVLAELPDWLHYDLPEDLIPHVWNGKYRGQRQKWFAMRFTGQDSDINLVTEHPEFSEWRWAQLRELPDIIVPFKRALYQTLVDRFAHLIPPA